MSSDISNFDPIPAPVPAPRQKKRHPLRIAVIAIVVVLLLAAAGFGTLRYFGPALVAQSYLNDLFANKFSDAVNLTCPAQQAQAKANAQLLGSLPSANITIDTSHLSYSLQNESLNSATIAIGGSIDAGSSATSVNVSYKITLQANGLWWCVSALHGGLST